MSPIRISIDLSDSPLRVGALQLGKYLVDSGKKGIKLTGGGASTTREEVVAALEDARNDLRYFLDATNFDAAVVVIPNSSSNENKENIISHGRHRGFNITQVIPEQVAVSAAYIQKVRPSENTTLAIISLSGGILDVSVITIVPLDVENINYHLILQAHKFHDEAIDFDESKHHQESGDSVVGGLVGLVGGAVEALVVDPFEKAFNILKEILGGLEIQPESKVEKLVFVGKASASEKVRQAAKESFPEAVVWDGNEKPEEIAAYGAAFLSYNDKKLSLGPPGGIIDVPYSAKLLGPPGGIIDVPYSANNWPNEPDFSIEERSEINQLFDRK